MATVRSAIGPLLTDLQEEWRRPVGSWGSQDLWADGGGVSRVHHMLVVEDLTIAGRARITRVDRIDRPVDMQTV